jgi:hypothetical protein
MKMLLIIVVLLFSWTSVAAVEASPVTGTAYVQKRDDEQRKKDRPGPPVVKDKGKDSKPKEPPKRGKKRD